MEVEPIYPEWFLANYNQALVVTPQLFDSKRYCSVAKLAECFGDRRQLDLVIREVLEPDEIIYIKGKRYFIDMYSAYRAWAVKRCINGDIVWTMYEINKAISEATDLDALKEAMLLTDIASPNKRFNEAGLSVLWIGDMGETKRNNFKEWDEMKFSNINKVQKRIGRTDSDVELIKFIQFKDNLKSIVFKIFIRQVSKISLQNSKEILFSLSMFQIGEIRRLSIMETMILILSEGSHRLNMPGL